MTVGDVDIMALHRSLYRLAGLDGRPHPVLDTPYESLEAALMAAQAWCEGQGMSCSLGERAIGVEVMTSSGSWRTIRYPVDCMREVISI